MRRFVLMVVAAALPVAVFALDRAELDCLLARAAAAQGTNYLAIRADLLAPGTNALPLLAAAAVDAGLDWRQRLVARIGYERIVRGADIERFRRLEWHKEPGFDPAWSRSHAGPGLRMEQLAITRFRQFGLWFYYIEMLWKDTAEITTYRLRDADSYWPAWGFQALFGEPEFHHLKLALVDRVEQDPLLSRKFATYPYGKLIENRFPDAVPVLVRRYEAYNKREVTGQEYFPGRYAELFRGMFAPILDFADERHVELLEAYIAEHPALAELKPKLAEVRARPAPAPVPEPPFRLGTMPVPVP